MAVEEGFTGFVVTPARTRWRSRLISFLLWDSDEPVIFTGSQFSPTDNNTDAFHYISNALLIAASDESKNLGVLVAFNDRIFAAQYATKIHASNIDGFGSPRSGALGIVDFGRVPLLPKAMPKGKLPAETPLAVVEIVKEYMEWTLLSYDYHVSRGVEGLVIEGFGRGHTNMESTDAISGLWSVG
jgi:L-asparaginase